MLPDFDDFRYNSDLLHLFVRDCVKSIVIGVYDFEQAAPQRVRINIDVWVAMPQVVHDCIASTFNYEHLLKAIEEATLGAPYALQETFLERICQGVMAHPDVRHAHIQTEKLDVYPDAQGVGISVWRHQNLPV